MCPDGVPMVALGEICQYIKTGKLNANAMVPNGEYPFFTCDSKPYRIDKYAFDKEAILVSGNGSQVGHITYYKGKFNAYQRTYVLSDFKDADIFFILHHFRAYLKPYIMENSKKGSIPYITLPMLQDYQIPLPPLPIQQRIVETLDKFTSLVSSLDSEIALRQKQYEYYRNKLLTFEEGEFEWKTLSDCSENVCSGGTPSRSKSEYFEGNIPWLRTQEVDWQDVYDTEIKITEDAVNNSSAKLIPENCVIVAMYGATAGKSCINKIPLATNQACCNLQINKDIALYKYVYYYVCKEYKNIKDMGEGSQNNINGQKVKSFPIPVPSLSRQHSIVRTLDTFESLLTNLKKERALRQKQYEYYREKLLTFA